MKSLPNGVIIINKTIVMMVAVKYFFILGDILEDGYCAKHMIMIHKDMYPLVDCVVSKTIVNTIIYFIRSCFLKRRALNKEKYNATANIH